MSLGQLIDFRVGTFIPKSDESRTRKFMESLIDGGRKRIKIVTGEFDKSFYTQEIGNGISNVLKRGVIVNILLKEKSLGDKDQSIKALAKENYYFFHPVFKDMCEVERSSYVFEGLNFYLSKKRAKRHFALVDNDVFLETIHEEGQPRSVMFKRNAKHLAKKCNNLFENMIDSTHVYKIETEAIFKEVNLLKTNEEISGCSRVSPGA